MTRKAKHNNTQKEQDKTDQEYTFPEVAMATMCELSVNTLYVMGQ